MSTLCDDILKKNDGSKNGQLVCSHVLTQVIVVVVEFTKYFERMLPKCLALQTLVSSFLCKLHTV